jgi:hypothetical protein
MPRVKTVIAVKKVSVLGLLCVFGLLTVACGGGGGAGKGNDNGPAGGGRDGAAAGGGSAGATVPAGYTPGRAGRISVAAPPGWRPATTPKGWTLAFDLRAGKRTVAQLGVISDVPQVDSVRLVAAGAFAGVQIHAAEVRRAGDRELRVPGAGSALRVDYTYVNVAGGEATGEAARGADVSVVYGARRAATVRITGLQRDLTPQLVDQIVQTIAVSG